jgi:hypothetical protein
MENHPPTSKRLYFLWITSQIDHGMVEGIGRLMFSWVAWAIFSLSGLSQQHGRHQD